MAKQVKKEKTLVKDTPNVTKESIIVDTPNQTILTEQPNKDVVKDTPVVTEDTITEEVENEENTVAPQPVIRRSDRHDGGIHF